MHGGKTHEPYEQMIHSSWGRRLLVKHRTPQSSCVCGLSIVLLRKLAMYCDYLWYILRATNFYEPGLRYGKIVKPTVDRSHHWSDPRIIALSTSLRPSTIKCCDFFSLHTNTQIHKRRFSISAKFFIFSTILCVFVSLMNTQIHITK